MAATHSLNSTASFAPVLYVAFELSSGQWKLASTTARGQRARVVSVQARNSAAVLREIARAKARFGVPESAGVFSCYEAGRDGFWLYRCYRVDPQEREAIPHGRRNVIRIMLAGLNSASGVRFIVGWSVAVSAAG